MASPYVSIRTTYDHDHSAQNISTTYTSYSQQFHRPQLSTPHANMSPGGENFTILPHPHPSPVLPLFSSIETLGPSVSQRYQSSYPDSDIDDEDDNGELPAQGLLAPWEVLRRLADVVSERTTKVSL